MPASKPMFDPSAPVLASDPLVKVYSAMLAALAAGASARTNPANAGFDWNDIGGALDKTEEEWLELKTELGRDAAAFNHEDVALEFGDVLFTLTNVARFAGIHPETALSAAIQKFEKRFAYMERISKETGEPFENLAIDDMQALWQQAKENSQEKP